MSSFVFVVLSIYNCVQVYFRCPSLQLTWAILFYILCWQRGMVLRAILSKSQSRTNVLLLNWIIIVVIRNDLTCLETAFYVLIKFSTLFAFVLIWNFWRIPKNNFKQKKIISIDSRKILVEKFNVISMYMIEEQSQCPMERAKVQSINQWESSFRYI